MALSSAQRQRAKYVNPVPTTIGGLSLMFKVLPRFLVGAAKRSPHQLKTLPPTDAAVYATPPPSGLRLTWFGHSSSLIEIDGVRILIDPVWDDRAAPTQWFGPRRFFPPTLPLEDLPRIDLVLISHDHYDHFGAGTIRRLAAMAVSETMRGAQWIAPLGVGALLQTFGVSPDLCTELDWTQTAAVKGITVVALPARHFSGRGVGDRFRRLWASFALLGPRHRVYYGADSGEWEGFHEIGQRWGPFDLTMLEIGAFDPLWADIHMGPEGAVRSFAALGGRGLLMPIHWGLFDLALHPWTQPIESVLAAEGLPLWSPSPGVPSEVVAGEQLRSDWWRHDRE